MQIAYDAVHLRLVEAVPEFAPVLAEHLEDQEGELLQHVLFGDLTRFVVDAYERGDHELVSRCLDFLDEVLRNGDEMTQNLVGVSFVENVGPWDEAAQAFIADWPDALGEEARRQREWLPGEPER
ncbi:MAG: DUF7674 family protein [Acidimicrobiales bacterium]